MNKGYFNSKYNIIIGTGVDESKILNITEHNIIHRVNTDKSFQQICFNIKKYQLDHDEVFSGNVIINKLPKDTLNITEVIKLPLDDNSLYSSNFKHTGVVIPNSTVGVCMCDDELLYCSSIVLWIISQRERTVSNNLYSVCRKHRIKLKGFE